MPTYENATGALHDLKRFVLEGEEMGSRGGEVRERRHVQICIYRPWQREITDPTRGANIAAQIAETMWVLAGRNDIEWLSHYLPRAKEFSDDGKTWRAGYGPRLRAWDGNDQLKAVVNELRHRPDSRRAVISLWDPSLDWVDSKDIPCNNWLHFLVRNGKLEMQVVIRSNDLWWGWSGINQFEWSALQEIIASELKVEVGPCWYSIGSLHLYKRHWAKAAITPELDVSTYEDSPRYDPEYALDERIEAWFEQETRIREGKPASIDDFPDPMMRSWLRILQWYWSGGDEQYLEPLKGTRLEAAAHATPATLLPKRADTVPPFIQWACELHARKDEAYGNSWIKRGPLLGAVANIDRKLDRLGKSTDDETALDTATDLMLYLAKYQVWSQMKSETGEVHRKEVQDLLQQEWRKIPSYIVARSTRDLEDQLRRYGDMLDEGVRRQDPVRTLPPIDMLRYAMVLGHRLYRQQANAKRGFSYEA